MMRMLPKQPTVKAAAATFTGDAWYDTLIRGEGPSHIRVAVVRFAPGARNAWHAHPMGQTVHVTEGIGRIGPMTETSSRCIRGIRSIRLPANGIGMAPPPIDS